MRSLLAILEGRGRDAQEAMTKSEVVREPEILFYFARHFSMLGDAAGAIEMLARAQTEGFTALVAIERDPAFSRLEGTASPVMAIRIHKLFTTLPDVRISEHDLFRKWG